MWRGAIFGAAVGAMVACFAKPSRQQGGGGDGGGGGDATTDGTVGRLNYMFVTSQPYLPYQLGSSADTICNTLANGKLLGTYVAWLSTSTYNARDRLGSARGWIRPDGLPFANTASEIAQGKMYYPPILDENGSNVGIGVKVATGTDASGGNSPGSDCGAYTGSASPIVYGFADGGAVQWTNGGYNPTCTEGMRLYCFGIDNRDLQVVAPTTAGPRAFVSNVIGLTGGVPSFDFECTAEANGNMVAGNFKAFMATTLESALTHVGTPTAPWVRLDGVPVTSDFATFTAPLDLTIAGTYVSAFVATGAMAASTKSLGGSDNCGDWGSTQTTTDFGLSARAMYRAQYAGNSLACSAPHPIYCVETP